MAYTKSEEARNEGLDAMIANLGSGYIQIYTGTRPASPNASATGTKLWEFNMDSAPFDASGTVTPGVASANGLPWEANAITGGTAGYFRLTKSDGTTGVFDGTITTTGGGGELELIALAIASAQPVRITALSITISV